MTHQLNPQAFDDLVTNLQQAEATLSAIVDQACLNGPDAVKPAALIAAHNLTHQASAELDAVIESGGRLPQHKAPALDSERYRKAVSSLEVLLSSMEADDNSGLTQCDALDVAIENLKAAGGMES